MVIRRKNKRRKLLDEVVFEYAAEWLDDAISHAAEDIGDYPEVIETLESYADQCKRIAEAWPRHGPRFRALREAALQGAAELERMEGDNG